MKKDSSNSIHSTCNTRCPTLLALQTPAEAIAKFKRQILRQREACSKLEQELNSCGLEIEKEYDTIAHMERVIYSLSTVSAETINSIAKELGDVDRLKTENLKFKKQLLFEKRMQFDYRKGSGKVEAKMDLERDEMRSVSEKYLENAKRRMEESITNLREEKEKLINKNIEIAIKLGKPFELCGKVYDEIAELKQAERICSELLEDDQYNGSREKSKCFPFAFTLSCMSSNNVD